MAGNSVKIVSQTKRPTTRKDQFPIGRKMLLEHRT
jgi:hypothetical protein